MEPEKISDSADGAEVVVLFERLADASVWLHTDVASDRGVVQFNRMTLIVPPGMSGIVSKTGILYFGADWVDRPSMMQPSSEHPSDGPCVDTAFLPDGKGAGKVVSPLVKVITTIPIS